MSIPNYDQRLEKRHHPENFEPANDIEVVEEAMCYGILSYVGSVSGLRDYLAKQV